MHNLDQSQVQKQIQAIGKYLQSVIITRKYSRNKIAEAAGISINTLKNVLKGQGSNISSAISIAWVMGLNIQEVVNGASVNPGLPKSLGEPSEASPAIDVNKVSEEEQKQSRVQLAARLGLTEEELTEFMK